MAASPAAAREMAIPDVPAVSVTYDWRDREDIDHVQQAVANLAAFLADFEASARDRLARLVARLATLERSVEFLEAQVAPRTGVQDEFEDDHDEAGR